MKTMRWYCMIALTITSFGISGCGDDGGDPAVDAPPVNNNTDPAASFTMTPNCTNAATDQITFESTSTDADGDALTCSWVFSSGNPATETVCTVSGVTFPNIAPYNVTLTVDDGNGGQATVTMPIAPC